MSNYKFYIEKLVISGSGKPDAVMNFNPGLNLIIGPSNSGKSLVIDCIDYVLGYKNKSANKKDSRYRLDGMQQKYGYDTIKLTLNTPGGKIYLTRVLREGVIYVESENQRITSGKYSVGHTAKLNTSSLMLQLLGINEHHEVLKSVGGVTEALTWRGISHLFIVKQDDIDSVTSPIITPAAPTVSQITSPAALLFLLSGIDGASIVKEKVDPKAKTKETGVIEYLEAKVNELEAEKENLKKQSFDADLQMGISEFTTSVDELRIQIDKGVSNSKAIMDEIYAIDSELSECRIMQAQFDSLRAQYQSDIDRMTFVIKGELAMAEIPENHVCPFCGGPTDLLQTPSYIEGAKNNLEHIKRHLEDLDKAEGGLIQKINKLDGKKSELLDKKKVIDAEVKRLTEEKNFMARIQSYANRLLSMRTPQQIEEEQKRVKDELIAKKTKKPANQGNYHIADYYSSELLSDINDSLTSILKSMHFPQADTAMLNTDTWDVQFGNLVKAGIAGGGYSSIVNSALILTLHEVMKANMQGQSTPVLLDSSLTALSESEYVQHSETIKANFLQHLMNNRFSGQVILAEQKEKMPQNVLKLCGEKEVYMEDGLTINQFSHDLNHGRVGLFPGVPDF